MPKLTVNINYGSVAFPGGSTFTRSSIEVHKAADDALVQAAPNVPATATSWPFNDIPPGLYNVTCQPMSGDSRIGTAVVKQYDVPADVMLAVPVSLA